MKVSVLSNEAVECGVAEYGRDLVRELSRWYDVSFGADGDIVLLNLHPGVLTVNSEWVLQRQQEGKKIIAILHNSADRIELATEMGALSTANAIVAHEPITIIGHISRFRVIPHGIPVVDNLPEPDSDPSIATAGFQFPWKRLDVVVSIAKRLGIRCRVIAPRSKHMSTEHCIERAIAELGGMLDVHRDWMPREEVIRFLARSTLTMFYFSDQGPDSNLGQSGSVRMGIAARRPIVISTQRRMKTLLPYTEEVYAAETEESAFEQARQIVECASKNEPVRRPEKVIVEQGWPTAAEKYRELIEEIAA